jgi:hypothetical protein
MNNRVVSTTVNVESWHSPAETQWWVCTPAHRWEPLAFGETRAACFEAAVATVTLRRKDIEKDNGPNAARKDAEEIVDKLRIVPCILGCTALLTSESDPDGDDGDDGW